MSIKYRLNLIMAVAIRDPNLYLVISIININEYDNFVL